jgi:uncharacterized membrane protein
LRIAALAVFFGLVGVAIGDGEGFLPGILFGVLVGVVLGNRTRLAKLEGDHASLAGEHAVTRHELWRLQQALGELQRSQQALNELRRQANAAAEPLPVAEAAPAQVAPAVTAAPEPAAPAEAPTAPEAYAPVRVEIAAQPQAPALDDRGYPLEPAPAQDAPRAQGPVEPGVEARGSAREQNMGAAAYTSAQPEQTPATFQSAASDGSVTPSPATGGELPLDGVERFLRELFFGGNTIVRVGILVLLVGVVLLLRWAAEHSVFPIELRMAAAGVLALGLVIVGYRQRELRPGFGRTLQGGGVAALYLVVFFSFRTYQLLPAGLAFALLVAIAIASGVLAVLQDALALVVIGQIGGFMAPVLASSGGGSHVALFSYYLLLNLLVFAVAWFKPWRALNLIGFGFTFGIGSTWGALRYRPEDFASTEPFLIAFFLLYSLIPVLYALRRRTAQGVDASLVFGTPLAVLLLQYAMVKDMRFGMAFSALGLGAFYVLVSRVLYKRAPEALRALIESFLAIGIGFATLAVPYGFDNHDFTGATWALEGAGLYWVGTRQQRWLSRAAGVGLQLLAALALLVQLDRSGMRSGLDVLPVANARFLASALLCLACLFVAHRAYLKRAELSKLEVNGLQFLIGLGLFFYLFAALEELDRHGPALLLPGLRLALVGASLFALSLVARRLSWLPGRFPALAWALSLPLWLLVWEAECNVHPLGRGGWLGFPIAFALYTELLRSFVPAAPASRTPLHVVYLWSAVLLLTLEAQHLVSDFAGLGQTWSGSAVAVVLALGLFVTVRGVRAERWPFSEAREAYLRVGAGVLALMAALWTWWANFSLAGDAAPLPSWPLLNPLDLAQLTLLSAALAWYLAVRSAGLEASVRRALPSILGGLTFLWFNALLARSVHHLAGVAFDPDALWDATPMQVSLSVSWSVLGLLGTVLASVKRLRTLWLIGASLLGLVVAKLFLIDLAQLSTIAKIGTFLVVGLLLVLVGYFAPVPPPGARTEGELAT